MKLQLSAEGPVAEGEPRCRLQERGPARALAVQVPRRDDEGTQAPDAQEAPAALSSGCSRTIRHACRS
jgi:hypothetical protein